MLFQCSESRHVQCLMQVQAAALCIVHCAAGQQRLTSLYGLASFNGLALLLIGQPPDGTDADNVSGSSPSGSSAAILTDVQPLTSADLDTTQPEAALPPAAAAAPDDGPSAQPSESAAAAQPQEQQAQGGGGSANPEVHARHLLQSNAMHLATVVELGLPALST